MYCRSPHLLHQQKQLTKTKAMTEKQYRTERQFLEITETMINGNWSQAAANCVEYGFYAKDLQDHYKSLGLDSDVWDYAELAELAQKLRTK